MATYSNFITLTSVSDADTKNYSIATVQETSYKFQTERGLIFSPPIIDISAYKITNEESVVLNVDEYDLAIYIVGFDEKFTDSFKAQGKNLFYLLSRLSGQLQSSSLETVNLLEDSRIIDSANRDIIFNFEKLLNYTVEDGGNNNHDDWLDYNAICELIREENLVLKLRIYSYTGTLTPTDNLLGEKIYTIEFGTSENMASFALTADSIQAAVNESKLSFDATNGLTVQNGGIKVVSSEGETLLGYKASGGLYIKGDGDFTGTIHATDGEFSGDVEARTLTALSGDIGGFYIEADGLYSKHKIDNDLDWSQSNSSIQLLGEQGKIVANSLDIGINATIREYLELGDAKAWIYNPDSESARGKVLQVGDKIVLKDDCTLKLGGLLFDGTTSTMYARDPRTNEVSVRIDPETAEFNNIIAKGRILTSIFEVNHVQGVGGSMFFKPSYKVENQEGMTLTLSSNFIGSEGDYLYLIGENGRIFQEIGEVGTIESDNVITIKLDHFVNDPIYSIVDMGRDGSMAIGINSNDGPAGCLLPRGLSIAEFRVPTYRLLTKDEETLVYEIEYTELENFKPDTTYYEKDEQTGEYIETEDVNPDKNKTYYELVDLKASGESNSAEHESLKLFLGDLNGLNIPYVNGYGLYGENVYLHGSLTTELEDAQYAGINTLSKAHFNAASGDTSAIVFWAGSDSLGEKDIQNAKFQVTQNGSLYASQGVFNGSIISNSGIYSSDIYAARIHGDNRNSKGNIVVPGLSFYNIVNGIAFFNGDYGESPLQVFHIGSDGFGVGADGADFISILGDEVTFTGTTTISEKFYTDGGLHLEGNYIKFNNVDYFITFNNAQQQLELLNSNNRGIELKPNNVTLRHSEIAFEAEDVKYTGSDSSGPIMRYHKVVNSNDNGYDLYIE